MSVWSLATAAVLAGITAGVGQQAAQVAQPAPDVTVVAQAVPAIYQEDNDQKVSASFNHAAVADVMDWLTKNGVSFVTADSELPKDATITLNVKDAPLGEVVDAIASALGGHWERRGSMRIFRHGEGFGVDGTFNVAPFMGQGKAWNLAPDEKGWSGFGKDGKVFLMPDVPKIELKDMPELKEMPDMDQLKERLKDVPNSEEIRQEVEKAMEESRKAMKQSGDEMRISKKAMEQARKEIEKARKEHPEAFNGRIFISPDSQNKVFINPNENGFFKVEPNGKGRTFQYRVGRPSMAIDGRSFTKFMASLSDEQKETNRRQGYLRLRDLSETQRKLLGISGDEKGGWTIKINKDGEEVTVKSND